MPTILSRFRDIPADPDRKSRLDRDLAADRQGWVELASSSGLEPSSPADAMPRLENGAGATRDAPIAADPESAAAVRLGAKTNQRAIEKLRPVAVTIPTTAAE